MKPVDEKAQRRAAQLAAMTDEQLADTYVQTLTDPANLQFSPHLVTAVREITGLWDRLSLALAHRKAAAQ